MSSNAEFQMIAGSSLLRGFGTLLRRENQKWWTIRRALTRTAVWVFLLNGLLFLALFVFPNMTDPQGNRVIDENPLQMGSDMFAGLAAVGLAIGVIVVMQDTLIEEKQLGTVAWVLSKPISRTAFLSAKLVANVIGLLLLMVLPTALAAYGLFQLYEPGAITLPNMAAMTAVISLHALFYLTLALLMGTLTNSRGLLLAVTLGSLLGGGLVPVEALVKISPWQLQRVGVMLLHGQPIDTIGTTMIGATVVWCLLFLVTAVWRFEHTEF
jgi:ABC-2 type transport system permease protein